MSEFERAVLAWKTRRRPWQMRTAAALGSAVLILLACWSTGVFDLWRRWFTPKPKYLQLRRRPARDPDVARSTNAGPPWRTARARKASTPDEALIMIAEPVGLPSRTLSPATYVSIVRTAPGFNDKPLPASRNGGSGLATTLCLQIPSSLLDRKT
jgi:hypothetical protein